MATKNSARPLTLLSDEWSTRWPEVRSVPAWRVALAERIAAAHGCTARKVGLQAATRREELAAPRPLASPRSRAAPEQ